MDPNETLRLLREVFSDWEDERGDGKSITRNRMVAMLDDGRDAFTALDEWLSKRGFLPDDWAEGGA